MGSGAYAVFIDQQVPGGGPTALRRVVPLPPPELSGGVKFTTQESRVMDEKMERYTAGLADDLVDLLG